MDLHPSITHNMLITKEHFDHDLTIHAKSGEDTFVIMWKRYDQNVFYTDKSWAESLLWSSMEAFFGHRDFILVRPINWIYPWRNVTLEETLLDKAQRRQGVIGNLLKKSRRFYPDIVYTIIDYVGN